ncbi:hypothetical protein AgCh_016517 [Apium graveolens]
MIYDGPYRPMKVVVSLTGEPEKMIDKDRKDYSPEDISSIMKDTKVRHILHISLDSVLSNRIIGYEIYGVLKTHELKMEKRNKRKGSKARPVALKDTNSDHNKNEDMEKMVALLAKSFKKMVYKNFKKGRRFSRKGSSSSNSDKRNNRRNTDGKESRSGKLDKSKVSCYNCDGIGHFAADCRKPRVEKKQALILRKRNWDGSSNSDDGVNYALMAKADVEADNAELKAPQTILAFDTDNIYELRLFLKSLHVSFRDQTLENNRIKSENSELKERNEHLEYKFLSMLEIQK